MSLGEREGRQDYRPACLRWKRKKKETSVATAAAPLPESPTKQPPRKKNKVEIQQEDTATPKPKYGIGNFFKSVSKEEYKADMEAKGSVLVVTAEVHSPGEPEIARRSWGIDAPKQL